MLMAMLEKPAAEQRETIVKLRSSILHVCRQWVPYSHGQDIFTSVWFIALMSYID